MTHPDARSDLAGALNWLMDRSEALGQGMANRRISATAAATAFGYSASYFRAAPWRIPDFGKNGTLHSRATWESWLSRPELERRAEWDSMTIPQRRKAPGVA
ncbi:MAG: hypothetical protein NT080_08210 [Spirochaetes bacterium]|nr:hypothetical protein [Spirochaetota bacterium]